MSSALKFASLSLTMVIAGGASAEEIKVSGTMRYGMEVVETVSLGTDTSILSIRQSGTIGDDGPTPSVINDDAQVCLGTFVMAGQALVSGEGYCETVDQDNDKWWLSFSAAGGESAWKVVRGTGKFENMTGSGKTFFPADVSQPTASGEWVQKYEGVLNLPSR
jgi:hypothetical protein